MLKHKKQELQLADDSDEEAANKKQKKVNWGLRLMGQEGHWVNSVSYTHLTLPTIYSV